MTHGTTGGHKLCTQEKQLRRQQPPHICTPCADSCDSTCERPTLPTLPTKAQHNNALIITYLLVVEYLEALWCLLQGQHVRHNHGGLELTRHNLGQQRGPVLAVVVGCLGVGRQRLCGRGQGAVAPEQVEVLWGWSSNTQQAQLTTQPAMPQLTRQRSHQ